MTETSAADTVDEATDASTEAAVEGTPEAVVVPAEPQVRMLHGHVYDELPSYKQENGTRSLSKSDTLCCSCLEMFGSSTAFDMHRVGKHAYLASPEQPDGRRCLTPEEMEAREMRKDVKGRWRSPAGDRWWETAGSNSPDAAVA